jgi:hypothetical protein
VPSRGWPSSAAFPWSWFPVARVTTSRRIAGQTSLTPQVSRRDRGRPEVRVDVGTVNGQVFLINVSVGFYATMVHDPDYRRRRILVAARYASVPSSRGGGVRRCALQYLAGSWRRSRCW